MPATTIHLHPEHAIIIKDPAPLSGEYATIDADVVATAAGTISVALDVSATAGVGIVIIVVG